MNATCAPSAHSASATASAGTTWPAVPPAPITIFGAVTNRAKPSCPWLRDIEQQTDRGEHDAQVRRGVGDERQRDARQGRQPQYDEDVEQALAKDQRGQSGGKELRIPPGRSPRGAQARVGDHPVQEYDAEYAQDAELLADHREDEV